ncbi:unnamed protein product [Lupinus luteus]|uniref:BTB domain-containing protein n=1 Tax=Lupinus luteus TaxID=3873 RepID=A0AAV1XF25_LUPLU
MDCCVCTTMPLILRPPRNTICGACYEGARNMINMMNNLEKFIEMFDQQKEDLAFMRGFVVAFKEQIHTDILVNPGSHGPPIPAHKFVLAIRSEIFKNMLECDECKSSPNNTITIPDLNHEELESLLEFLYSGTLATQTLEKHVYTLSRAADKGRSGVNLQSRNFSSQKLKDELSIEEEAERKVGWLLKSIFFVTAGAAGYHFFPYMGENLMQQSVSLLRVKDPLYKRMGASRVARFAIDDERRMQIAEIGGHKELLNMLSTAKDDRTRKAALTALDALSRSDAVLASMHRAGAVSIIKSSPNSLEEADVEKLKLSLMKRFQDKKYDVLP